MSTDKSADPQAVRDLESRKLEAMVQIRQLEVELLKTDVELLRLGATDAAKLMCW